MVSIKELRVGNWVAVGVIYCKVNSIHTVPGIDEAHVRVSGFVERNSQYCLYDYQIDPIPLNDTILRRLGFKDISPDKNRLALRTMVNSIDELAFWFQEGFMRYQTRGSGFTRGMRHITSLHRLQNFTFEFLNKEFEIELS